MNQSTSTDTPAIPSTGLWRALRLMWCRHRKTFVTAKTDLMPAHVVCEACGWREPLIAATPKATRTWDSTRDEARYEREKKRRAVSEEQKLQAIAQLSSPAAKTGRPRRSRRGNIVELKRVVGG